MKKFVSCLFVVSLLLVVPSLVSAADLFVQSVKAPIFSAPSLGSQKIAEAVRGEMLKELEKKGDWYKVSYKDKVGWVSRLLVGTTQPMGKVLLAEEGGEKLEKGARKRASAFTTAAAARGLAEERARLSDKYKVDYKSVEAMETMKISDDEVSKFHEEGVGK
ncbi:MAG: hypothetical protein A3I04_03585 [Nitrospinae bacterium RIFCSPLOWO2_02_FULL_39_110]|nr:MAG: hypothetical protein A2W53_06990 [Nitrospinae bacterium RIFCSPHIGHO2_02_39_11]OGV99633.1 MAG: hypothetical protein A3D97_03000 [Nitrospinae bacterium RIFCSPHIGHO2_12_FULL_39_42]OGW01177.1 MAG: hypothetical protein A3D20_01095 [Nitrospinae bacterium RIFCSPHIGHO2_02_FULL_39_82]OGW05292.1 MAG: hypothetical protein A3I04_03585 [Nitrospinae bacterium RIFCSPLOWO2_02_FULL_39_110]OGW05535.1 MAG: hypothetical protein A2Z59_01580 [Nitrospinae bacterium RIFCSPLOWO2_02_39_17]OGW10099.1 MAG: hypoth